MRRQWVDSPSPPITGAVIGRRSKVHFDAAGGIAAALRAAQALGAGVPVQIRGREPGRVRPGAAAGATSVLLDNFDLAAMRPPSSGPPDGRCSKRRGGVTLDGLRSIAETGVDRISIGSLTKDVQATDYSLRMVGPAG